MDGDTRLPVYLKGSDNYRAETVQHLFIDAINEYDLPSSLHSDKGGENVMVSLHMLQHPLRGPGRGSMITGRSVHNQRIERMCRDVFEGVLYINYNLFYHLEENGILDPTNTIHLFAIHYVFIPRINEHLDVWKSGFVCHHIRSAGSRSPMQLYITGLLEMRGSERTVAREVYEPANEVLMS